MRALLADSFPEGSAAAFEALGLEVAFAPEAHGEALVRAAADTHILVVRSTRVTRAVIEAASTLALIIRAGAGYDTIDVTSATERGIYVANCPGKNSVAVAELTMGLLLAVDRRIVDNTMALRAGVWNKKGYGTAGGLKGRTLGVLGLGPIGRAVVKRALAFEMHVVGFSRSLTEARASELGIARALSLEAIARAADAVTLHLPQTAETTRLFGATFFAQMKPGAIFLNTSRAGLIDGAALLEAVKTKGLRVGLDVYENEPADWAGPFHDAIFAQENFVGTHHIGASTDEAQSATVAEAVRICRAFVQREQVPNVVNLEELARRSTTIEEAALHESETGHG